MNRLLSAFLPKIGLPNVSSTVTDTFLKACPYTLQQFSGLKYWGKVKLRCKDCYFVTRDEVLYVMCKSYGRHKQALKPKRPENTWILTHATQGTKRPW